MLNELYQHLDPVAFTIGPLSVRWYGLAYIAAFVVAYFLVVRISKRWRIGMSGDDVLTFVVYVAIGIIVFARLGYCLFYGDGYYLQHPMEILAVEKGGMSFHGGLIGAILGGLVAKRAVRQPFLTLCDLGAIVAPVGLFFGRCANFVNGELWGKVTDLPWGVVFAQGGSLARHPSQLYEAFLEGAVIFIVLFALSRKLPPRPRGTFLGTFLLLYGIFRFLIEFVRVPDEQLGYLVGGVITMGQLLSAPLVVVSIVLLCWVARRKLPQGRRAGENSSDAVADSRS